MPLQLRPSTTLQNVINIVAMGSHGQLQEFFLRYLTMNSSRAFMGRGRINCEAIGLILLTGTVENSATRVFHSETATRETPHCSLVQALLCPCATVGLSKPPITCYYPNPSDMNREVINAI